MLFPFRKIRVERNLALLFIALALALLLAACSDLDPGDLRVKVEGQRFGPEWVDEHEDSRPFEIAAGASDVVYMFIRVEGNRRTVVRLSDGSWVIGTDRATDISQRVPNSSQMVAPRCVLTGGDAHNFELFLLDDTGNVDEVLDDLRIDLLYESILETDIRRCDFNWAVESTSSVLIATRRSLVRITEDSMEWIVEDILRATERPDLCRMWLPSVHAGDGGHIYVQAGADECPDNDAGNNSSGIFELIDGLLQPIELNLDAEPGAVNIEAVAPDGSVFVREVEADNSRSAIHGTHIYRLKSSELSEVLSADDVDPGSIHELVFDEDGDMYLGINQEVGEVTPDKAWLVKFPTSKVFQAVSR